MSKKLQILVGLAMAATFVASASAEETATPAPAATTPPAAATPAVSSAATMNDVDKLSYSIGTDLGKNIKRQDITINPTMMAKGIQDAISGSPLLLTDAEMKEVLATFQKNLMAKRAASFSKMAKANQDKGTAFLAANKIKPGVVTLPSGLQYKIITKGTGDKPKLTDTVTVEYTGKLLDGHVFDSTKEKGGKPATFNLAQVIPGWTEALLLMPVGSTWELYIPAALAYGERNVAGAIGPNETLTFEIHLLSIKK